jgi:hypothetical protein
LDLFINFGPWLEGPIWPPLLAELAMFLEFDPMEAGHFAPKMACFMTKFTLWQGAKCLTKSNLAIETHIILCECYYYLNIIFFDIEQVVGV